MQISGNTILITGGGSGIGRALAEEFHALGNAVVIARRRQQVLDETAANPGIRTAVLDIEKPDSIIGFAGQVVQDYPKLNVLIDAEAIVTTNLLGTIRFTAALIPQLLKQPRAAILTISSGLAFLPMAITPTYCATKAALHSYSQSLRYQLRDTPVQVIELVPPYVQTELLGPQQASDLNAMPLRDYISETINLLKASPEAHEILVERVKPLRLAEVNGGYDAFFEKFNDAVSAGGH